ncbi:hypothetical protein [Spirillospora sp. CA-128828]|uniref:hypothetical protein n=1 Tax=Spirillospora sp. CA-128828 TaxID=3240033 RepID=UPI003D8BF631
MAQHLLLAWRGRDFPDRRIFFSLMQDDGVWGEQAQLPGALTGAYPLVSRIFDGYNVLTFKGEVPSEKRVFRSNVYGYNSFGAPFEVANIRSQWGLSLAAPPRLNSSTTSMGAWVSDGGQIWYATDSIHARPEAVPGATSNHPPMLLNHREVIYLFWRGRDNQHFYWSSLGTNGWGSPIGLTDRISSDVPAVTSFGNWLVMAWVGGGTDSTLYYSVQNAAGWSAQRATPFKSAWRPTLAEFNGKLYMAWKGENDPAIHWSFTTDGTHWSPEQTVPGAGTYSAPSMAAYR